MKIPSSPQRSLIVFAVVIVAATGLRVKQYVDDRRPIFADVTVAGHVFRAEVADTPAKLELGLGKRDALAPSAAMYFPMGDARRWLFWMKGMRFPIDIVWIADGKVVDVSPNAPPPQKGQDPTTFNPSDPADAVLEINAGQAEAYGIRPGADVRLDVFKRE